MGKSGINTRPFKYEVGQVVQTKTGEVTVIGLIRQKQSPKERFNHKYIQYRCNLDGYEGEILEANLEKGGGCLVCGQSRVVSGFNDVATLHHDKVKFFYNEEDAALFKLTSSRYADFKCQSCGGKIPHRNVSSMLKREIILCPLCSDKTMSFGEKMMWSILRHLNIEFLHNSTLDWSCGKRYDFVLINKNTIIEMDGMQHSIKSFSIEGADSIEEVKANDKYKEDLALSNGIEHYVHIDTKESEFSLIQERILNSELKNIIDLSKVDWNVIKENMIKPIGATCLELWNNGMKSTIDIANKLNIGVDSVRSYMKKYAEIGKCDYDAKQARISYKAPEEINYFKQKKVICLNNLYIFDRMIYASRWCDNKKIVEVCKGRKKHAGRMPGSGEKLAWQYLDDYLKEHPEIRDKERFIKEHTLPPIPKENRRF